jgi:hypothetical protein
MRRAALLLSILCAEVALGDAGYRGILASISTRAVLVRGLIGAAVRLRQPGCAAVLGDFSDADGRTLDKVIEATGVTPADYLKRVYFTDGDMDRCATNRVFFTYPGSHVVFVCPLVRQEPSRHVELYVIHELLHVLGQGENPPSSAEITNQVGRRCS